MAPRTAHPTRRPPATRPTSSSADELISLQRPSHVLMNGGVKTLRRSSRAKLSKVSQERLVDAALSQGARHLQDCREESAEAFAPVAQPEPSTERQIDTTSDIAQSTRTNTQRPVVEDEKAEQTVETTLQQAKPTPPKRPYASLEYKVEGPEQVSPATLLRKRQFGSDSDDDDHQSKRARLTRENLALFSKMTKKKGTNKSSARPDSTAESSTSKTTSTTSSGFADHAYKNGILHPLHSEPPKNLENIHKRLDRSRETASPPESVYERYANNVGKAPNEATMVVEVTGKLLKEYDDKGYNRVFNQAFTSFPKDVGFNNGLSAPQPDFIEGLEKLEYDPFPVDECVSGAILYKDDPFSLTLPHLAGEWKGRGKDMDEARLQSAYVGAALVYARNEALSYIGKSDPPGHAEVTTFTTDGTNVNVFVHYSALSEDGTLKYHQYPVRSTNLINSHQGLKDGRRGLRNEQDHARKQSYALRDQLKEHGKNRRGSSLHPIAEGVQPLPVPDAELPDTTYADEDEDGYEVIDQQPAYQPTPPTSSKPKHGKTSSSRSSHSTVSSTPSAVDFASDNGHKRKTPSSQSSRSSKKLDYWQVDEVTDRHFHVHRDGTLTWRD